MPKARQTCTRCSVLRQKCDRKIPCTRCVRADVADACSRTWHGGYDARVHRTYPKRQDGKIILNTSYGEAEQRTAGSDKTTSGTTAPKATGSWTARSSAAESGTAGAADIRPHNDLKTIAGPEEGRPLSDVVTTHRHNLSDVQSLLPDPEQITQLVDYHDQNLAWYHGCTYTHLFRTELDVALSGAGNLDLASLDLRWCALLFAIMAASLTSVSDKIGDPWRIPSSQKSSLSRKWYDAALSCLELAEYMARPHIKSLQAIIILSISSHMLHNSSKQFVLFGTALRIAQSLGLQKLAYDDKLDSLPALDTNALLKRELSRQVWSQICMQDWFSAVSLDMYCIRKEHFSTTKPRRIDSETMTLAQDDMPLHVDVQNHLNEIAALVAEFQDAVCLAAEPAANYEMILTFDGRLRALTLPSVLSANSQLDWVRWARTSAVVVHANKIIMFHRRLLSRSFKDPRYAYTRWASISASKTVIQEIDRVSADAARPALWNDQAHMVGAAITLCLDMFQRPESDPEVTEHRRLIDRAIELLGTYGSSTLASRGLRLLSTLLRHGAKQRGVILSTAAESLAWPLESSRDIEAIWPADTSRSQQGASLPPQTEVGETAETKDVNPAHVDSHSRDALADTSWMDMFSEYFPSQDEFDSFFQLDNLVP